MLATALILLAIALIVVIVLLRRGFVSPAEWAKKHDAGEESEADIRSRTPDGTEPPRPPDAPAS